MEELGSWSSMPVSIDLETPFIFGQPFPLAARMWTSLGSNESAFGGGSLGVEFVEVHTLLDGVLVPFSYSYVESPPEPTPEVSTSLLVATGLGLMLLRPGKRIRNRQSPSG